MIDDLIIIADEQTEIIFNNYSITKLKAIIRRLNSRFNLDPTSQSKKVKLEESFTLNDDPFYCDEKTMLELIAMFEEYVHYYSATKSKPLIDPKRLSRILKALGLKHEAMARLREKQLSVANYNSQNNMKKTLNPTVNTEMQVGACDRRP